MAAIGGNVWKERLFFAKYEKIHNELKPMCQSVEFHEYLRYYTYNRWKGKTVIDIGADIGSSAIFFIMEGAQKVYLLENDMKCRDIYAQLRQREPYKRLLKDTELIEEAQLPSIKADILKMDCEGCESYLLNEAFLSRFKEWVIGLHTTIGAERYAELEYLLQAKGGKCVGNVDEIEYIWVKGKNMPKLTKEEKQKLKFAAVLEYLTTTPLLVGQSKIRRLTPLECERLMSWHDEWTRWGIDEKGNNVEISDTQRYRMAGNGVVSNVVKWIIENVLLSE